MIGYGARQHIRRNALQHLHQEVTITRKHGSFTLEESLARLVRDGLVDRADALARAVHPDDLLTPGRWPPAVAWRSRLRTRSTPSIGNACCAHEHDDWTAAAEEPTAMRRQSIAAVLTGLLTTLGCGPSGRPAATAPAAEAPPFSVTEATSPTCRRRWPPAASRRASSPQIPERIAIYEDRLNASLAREPTRARGGRRARPRARARASCAARCTASRSRSRTTSTPRICRRPAARWRFAATCRPTKRR